jgi:hypothetical protein
LLVPRIVDSRPLTLRPVAAGEPLPAGRAVRAATTLLAVGALLLAVPATASAGVTRKIFEACGEEKIPTGYSQQAYSQALRQMPPELAEYSDCADLIHKAQLASAAGGGGGGGAGGGGASLAAAIPPPSPSEQQALERVARGDAGPPVKVGGELLRPGVVHANIASALGKLPTPLLALLAFLLACAALVLGRLAHTRVRARRHGV